MSNTALINLLAGKTALYTQLLASNIKTGEFYNCKQIIEQVTAEIELRKGVGSTAGNSTVITSISDRKE